MDEAINRRSRILDELQRISGSQAALLHRLIELGLLNEGQVQELIDRLVRDRWVKAQSYLRFAQQLDYQEGGAQVHIVSRCYYAMYHAVRAVVFHTKRMDVDDHERLAAVFTQVVEERWGIELDEWRKLRNRVEYSPYLPANMEQLCVRALERAAELLAFCANYLKERGMKDV